MNKFILVIASSLLSFACFAEEQVLDAKQQQAARDAENHGCPVSEAEEVVCGNIMCDFGLLMGEYPDRCWDYKAKLLVLKAKLLPWEKLPRCFKRDENCKKTGRAGKEQMDSTYCMDNADSKNDKEICLGAMRETESDYCSSLGSEVERRACDEIKISGKLTEEYCDNMALEKTGIRHQISWRWGIVLTRTTEWIDLPQENKDLYNQVFQECMSLSAR